MKSLLEQALSQFLKENLIGERRVLLLALSGGVDSSALFYALLPLRQRFSFSFHVAHVDHAWRKESGEQARALQELAQSYGVPFHLKTLNPEEFSGNKENYCRQERLAFFSQLTEHFSFQAILLGHHAGDQAETVLKRIFEGAGITKWGGLQSQATVQGLHLWRPLLGISKKFLKSWMQERNHDWLHDTSNEDSRYLRVRMRQQLLPNLSEYFGKEVEAGLLSVAEQSHELKDYLDQKALPYFQSKQVSPLGELYDFSKEENLHRVELKHFLRALFLREGEAFSRDQLEFLSEALLNKKANQRLKGSKKDWFVDRKCLFVFDTRLFSSFQEAKTMKLRAGVFQWGPWEISLQKGFKKEVLSQTSWREVWRGAFRAYFPQGDFLLSGFVPGMKVSASKRLVDWWNQSSVPCFMRLFLPVVLQDNQVVHEFLSGRSTSFAKQLSGKNGDKNPVWKLSFQYRVDDEQKLCYNSQVEN